jgi:hypothetical protein
MRSESSKSSGYQDLIGLAQSRNIRVIEAEGLKDRSGLRFTQQDSDYIAINSSLPETEKSRALGFLLENSRTGVGMQRPSQTASGGQTYLSSLQCSQG